MKYREWEKEFKKLGARHRMTGFEIGDAILKAEKELGGDAYQAMLKSGLAESTLLDMSRIAERWPVKERDSELGYIYYRDAGGDKVIAQKLLASVKKNSWSREEMRRAKRILEKTKNVKEREGGKK